MKRMILNYFAAIIFATSVGGAAVATTATVQPVSAACSQRLLTFPAWYKGLLDDKCEVKNPNDAGGISTFIWKIVLNVIELLLQVVAYAAVGYIIWGGFRYMTSTGMADKMAGARKTIMNAVIGLVISIFSIAFVNVIAGAIK